jgi:hypothetical protein
MRFKTGALPGEEVRHRFATFFLLARSALVWDGGPFMRGCANSILGLLPRMSTRLSFRIEAPRERSNIANAITLTNLNDFQRTSILM